MEIKSRFAQALLEEITGGDNDSHTILGHMSDHHSDRLAPSERRARFA